MKYFRFKLKYLIVTLLLFLVEVLIAIIFKDGFIRHTLGDVLVVILIYYFVKTFLNISYQKLIPAVFLFAVLVETSQHFNLIQLLGLQDKTWAIVTIGTSFSWGDIGAYAVGLFVVLVVEIYILRLKDKKISDLQKR